MIYTWIPPCACLKEMTAIITWQCYVIAINIERYPTQNLRSPLLVHNVDLLLFLSVPLHSFFAEKILWNTEPLEFETGLVILRSWGIKRNERPLTWCDLLLYMTWRILFCSSSAGLSRFRVPSQRQDRDPLAILIGIVLFSYVLCED